MKRRIRYMALLLVLCMLALTGCAQPRDTMTLRVCLDAAPATLDPAMVFILRHERYRKDHCGQDICKGSQL